MRAPGNKLNKPVNKMLQREVATAFFAECSSLVENAGGATANRYLG